MKGKSIIILLGVSIIALGAVFAFSGKADAKAESNLEAKEEGRTFIKYDDISDKNDNMNFNFRDFTGQWSFLELTLEKDNTIVIEDNSKVRSGKLYMDILDCNYNLIAEKEVDGRGSMNFLPYEDGKYFIRLVGKNASGDFDVKINSDKKYESVFKGKFDDRGSMYIRAEKWV